MHTILNSYTFDYGFTAFFQLQDCWLSFEKLLEVNLCQIICEINSLNKHLEPFNAFPLNSFWLNIVSCTNFMNAISEIDTLKINWLFLNCDINFNNNIYIYIYINRKATILPCTFPYTFEY